MKKLQVKIDTDRIDSFVEKQEARAAQIRGFVNERKDILMNSINEMTQFTDAIGAENISIGNMYSTHNDEQAYTDAASMLVHMELRLKRAPKNIELFKNKVVLAFHRHVTLNHTEITCRSYVMLHDNNLHMVIYVK
jgi:hypothetical protein